MSGAGLEACSLAQVVRHPKIGCTGLRDRAVESYPAFARGDGEPVALVLQGVQAGQGFGEERHVVVVGIEIVCGVGFRQFFAHVFAGMRGEAADDFGQAVTDEGADGIVIGDGHAAVGKTLLEGADNRARRVCQRSVPVEDNQFRFHRALSFRLPLARYSGLTLNQYGVASPCRTICTVCGFVALS